MAVKTKYNTPVAVASYDDKSISKYTGIGHIRAKPEMYVKSKDTIESQVQVFKEVIDNSADESIDPNRNYTIKIVFFHNKAKTRYQVMISDMGRGVPINRLSDVFTELFSSGKYDTGAAYTDSTGTFGVGIKTTVGLSNRFVAISKRNDGIARIEVCKGVTKRLDVERPIDKNAQTVGTIVYYEPDETILSVVPEFMEQGGLAAATKLIEWISVYSPNTIFEIYTESKLLPDNFFAQPIKDIWTYFKFLQPEQVVYISDKTVTPFDYVCSRFNLNANHVAWQLPHLHKAIDRSNDADRIGYEIDLFAMKEVKWNSGGLVAAVNMTSITDAESYHIVGINQLIKSKVEPLIEDVDLKEFFIDSYKLPVYGSIMTRFSKYTPVGQTKDAFKDKFFLQGYTRHLAEELSDISEVCWENFFDVIKEDLLDKYTKFSNKDLQLGQDSKNLAFKLNNKCFTDCNSTNPLIRELFITEGTSAGDHVQDARDQNTQAIFLARGKPLNAFRVDKNTMFSNKVMADLIRVLNVSPSDKDLSKMKFHYIILLADADSHGYHIVSLFIGALYKINPLILSEGRVFIGNPPLYALKTKHAMCYPRDNTALLDTKIQYVYSQAMKIHARNLDSGQLLEITGEAFRSLCYAVNHIGTIITRIADQLTLDPMHLEQLCHCVKYLEPGRVQPEKITKLLGLDNTIYKPETDSLILVVDSIELNVPLANLVKELKAFVLPELELLHWKKLELRITGTYSKSYYNQTEVSIMQLYQIFKEELDKGFTVTRMKGLGSMSADSLAETCMEPLTRSITRITSIGEVQTLYTWLGVNTDARKQLVQQDLDEAFGN